MTPTFRPGDTVGFAGNTELCGKLLKRERWPSRNLGDTPEYRWYVRLEDPDTGTYLWVQEAGLLPLSAELESGG